MTLSEVSECENTLTRVFLLASSFLEAASAERQPSSCVSGAATSGRCQLVRRASELELQHALRRSQYVRRLEQLGSKRALKLHMYFTVSKYIMHAISCSYKACVTNTHGVNFRA
jgi:hypothetical protein